MSKVHPISTLWRWVRYRSNLQALTRLDERTLNDIGLTRSAIRHAAWEKSAA
jgi:uncharacterized protein YjiS (DUF1127 family)